MHVQQSLSNNAIQNLKHKSSSVSRRWQVRLVSCLIWSQKGRIVTLYVSAAVTLCMAAVDAADNGQGCEDLRCCNR